MSNPSWLMLRTWTLPCSRLCPALVVASLSLSGGLDSACQSQELSRPGYEATNTVVTEVAPTTTMEQRIASQSAHSAAIVDWTGEPQLVESETNAQQVEDSLQPLPIEEIVCDTPICADDSEAILFGDWLGYNAAASDTTWLTGNADDFGIVSLESYPTLALTDESSIVTGSGFHFLNGPAASEMPARLFDFQIAYHSRALRSENFVFDVKYGVGAFSDFEGSVRKGIRFPGHAIGYYQWQPWLISVLGMEVLDRDDISVLPVAGFVWRPRKNVVAEVVFPKPKLSVQVSESRFVYLAGELGGGTWAVERYDQNDVATYRDLRLLFGQAHIDEGDASSIELGWSFARSLEFRSGVGNYKPDDTLFIRLRSLF